MAEASDDSPKPEGASGASYKIPEKKSYDQLRKLDDKGDESLRRYRDSLLSEVTDPPFPSDPRNIIVEKLEILVDGRPDVCLNLTGDISKLKDSPVVLKEGTKHRLRITYYVQRDIVAGLKYTMRGHRLGVEVWSESVMLGSYAPKATAHVWLGPEEEIPSGMTARGHYLMKDSFTNDDGVDPMQWEWTLDIKENW